MRLLSCSSALVASWGDCNIAQPGSIHKHRGAPPACGITMRSADESLTNPIPAWVLAPGSRLPVGCTDGPDRMLSAPFAGGCSSTKKDTSPRTRRWAPSSAKWKAWATPTSTEARGSGTSQTMSSPPRLVGQSVRWSKSARACLRSWNFECVCHTTPNWSALCLPPAASHSYRCWRDCGKSGSDQTSTKPWIKLSARINVRLTQAAMMERLCCQSEQPPSGRAGGHQAVGPRLTWRGLMSTFHNLATSRCIAKFEVMAQ